MSNLTEIEVTVTVGLYDHEMTSEEEMERQIRKQINQNCYTLQNYEY